MNKQNICKILEWVKSFYSENGDQLLLDDNLWYISQLDEDNDAVRNCVSVTSEELTELYLLHNPNDIIQ